jgi:hypothetical protein
MTRPLTTRKFWADAAERAVKTFAQSLLALGLTNASGLLDVNWAGALSGAGLAAAVSVLTSVGSSTVGDDSASLVE